MMTGGRLTLCCAEDNDLYRVLCDCGAMPRRCRSVAAAVRAAPAGGAVPAMRARRATLFDLSIAGRLKALMPALVREMGLPRRDE